MHRQQITGTVAIHKLFLDNIVTSSTNLVYSQSLSKYIDHVTDNVEETWTPKWVETLTPRWRKKI